MPDFTVVMATWNRGRHILPSVQSVLQQSHRNFELLVIGDDATDDTADHLATISDERLRWINNAPRWGTQSGPNNCGIACAKAPFVAYIGHDDIWAPDHLAAMWEVRQQQPEADVIVSGLMGHRVDAARRYYVCGMLTSGSGQETRCFVPPTSTAHRVEIVRDTPWPRKEDAIVAIDFDLQVALAEKGARFAATGRITAHKFTSAARYLSYFEPESVEQEHMLTHLRTSIYPDWLKDSIQQARRTGDFMREEARPGDRDLTQQRIALVAQGRGIAGLPDNLPVSHGISLLQSAEPRVGDWRQKKPGSEYRFAGGNPNPRLLIPLIADDPVIMRLRIMVRRADHLREIRLRLNGEPVGYATEIRMVRDDATSADLVFAGALRGNRASILVIEQFNDEIRSGKSESSFAAGALTVHPDGRQGKFSLPERDWSNISHFLPAQ